MNIKHVAMTMAPREPHWVGDGFFVHNFIPTGYNLDRQSMDPFLLLDYNAPYMFEPSQTPRGVEAHPHRGFETVTLAYQGKVEHRDSTGSGGIIEEGDVQWMTAGSGIIHQEFHEQERSEQGGLFQMVQLRINLPAKDKMTKPGYQAIKHNELATYESHDGKASIEVIAGKYKGLKGPAKTFSPIHLMNAKMQWGSELQFSFPAHYTTALLVLSGRILINDYEVVPAHNLTTFAYEGEEFTISAQEDAIILIMSWEPLNEPIYANGPFVMNTLDEVSQAFRDYHNNTFIK